MIERSGHGNVRALGAHERLLYLYSSVHHRHFCVVGELSGLSSALEVKIALRKLQQRHPHLRYAIMDNDDGVRFIEHDRPITVNLHRVSGRGGWRFIVETELATPFNPHIGALLRVNIIQNDADRTRISIVLTFHHSAADGLSAVALLHDLVAMLNGIELPLMKWRRSIEDLVREAHIGTTDRQDGQGASASAKDVRTSAALEIAKKPLWRDFALDCPKVAALQLSSNLTEAILSKSREHGASVHGALCAALTLANAPIHRGEEFSIVSPINIRSFAGVSPEEIGLFLTVASTRVSRRAMAEFWPLARIFTTEVAAQRQEELVAHSVATLEYALPKEATSELAQGLIGSLAYDAVLSNLGPILPRYVGEGARLEAVWGPMVLGRILNERMIGAATYKDQLRLTEARPQHMPASLALMGAQLATACNLAPNSHCILC